jgi:pimeloyl-ACP methyl ester carboxylesterase
MVPINIVMLPGLDGTGVLFRPVLKALPPAIRPIVVSYPTDQELGYEELLPVVRKALPRGAPFVLLGESFGGPLALRVAATRPAGLTAIILCASFISCPHPFVPAWIAPLVPVLPFRAFPRFSQLKALLGRYSTAELRALSREALSLVTPRVLAGRTREVIRVNVVSELTGLDCPVLYIQGKHDFVVPGGNLRRILRIKPEVQHVQLPAPHMVLQTKPEQAARAITGFIADITA